MITGKFTPEEDVVIRRECAKGLAYILIAQQMNRNKNSVQARAQKIGVSNGRKAGNPDKMTMYGKKVANARPEFKANPLYQISTGKPKTMLELGANDCRFSLEGKLFCAGSVEHGVYCGFHEKICYQNR